MPLVTLVAICHSLKKSHHTPCGFIHGTEFRNLCYVVLLQELIYGPN